MTVVNVSGDNYENSTALVITFTVLNRKDDTFQQMALEWEKAFLDLVHGYSSKTISVSYSAEVSQFLPMQVLRAK